MSDILTDDDYTSPSVEYIGFWKRFVSYLIDSIIMIIAIFVLVPKGNISAAMTDEGLDPSFMEAINADLTPVSLGVITIYLLVFWLWKQATPGLMIFSAKIVDATNYGQPPVTKWALRALLFVLPSILAFISEGLSSAASLLFIVSCIWVAIDERKQGLHDKIAGTLVIHK